MTLAIYGTPDNSGGEAGLGAAHLPTCIDLSYVLLFINSLNNILGEAYVSLKSIGQV